MVTFKNILYLSAALSAVVAHPNHAPVDSSLLVARGIQAKRCSSDIGAMKMKRHAFRKRGLRPGVDDVDTTFIIHAEAPKYDFLKNDTCILNPEITRGPYWYPPSQLLRRDITEGQPGVPLQLEIGVMDISSCQPAEGILIDIWHCNATGSYSSFTGNSPNVHFSDLVQEKTNASVSDFSILDTPSLHTDNTTFLRGLWPTDVHGVTSFSTIFPGFYVDRTIHIHVQAHTHWNLTKDGHIAHSTIAETGQIYIDEDLTEKIMSLEPYASHTEISRISNDEDSLYAFQLPSGTMITLDTEPLDGVDYANGVLGYITLGIDLSANNTGATYGSAPTMLSEVYTTAVN